MWVGDDQTTYIAGRFLPQPGEPGRVGKPRVGQCDASVPPVLGVASNFRDRIQRIFIGLAHREHSNLL